MTAGMRKAAVIGGGEIGVSMAAVLLDAGVDVEIVEPNEAVRERIPGRLAEFFEEMATAGLARGETAGQL